MKRHSRIANRSADEHRNLAGLDWGTIERFQKRFPKAEIIIKGIQTAEDAQIALDSGVGCIYVTNHGGRALDHARGAMDILPEVVDVVKGRVPVLVDGAFYRGTDVIKAIAMGAAAVGLGKLRLRRTVGSQGQRRRQVFLDHYRRFVLVVREVDEGEPAGGQDTKDAIVLEPATDLQWQVQLHGRYHSE